MFIAPAFAAITLFLIYPTIRTVVLSFANRDSTEFVGFSNYTELLSSPNFQSTLFNTLLWIVDRAGSDRGPRSGRRGPGRPAADRAPRS